MVKQNNLKEKIEVYLTSTTLKDLKDICERFSFTMSTFVRLAIQDKLRAEKAILSQCTQNQESVLTSALNGSEGSNKSRDEVNDQNE